MKNALFGSIAAGLFFVATNASAAMPQYNVVEYCKKVADTVGGSDSILSGCEQMEQAAYNDLKLRWESIPEKTRSYCDNVSMTVGGTYQILKGCIEQELSAAQKASNFTFQP